jgi:hypothetical protein
MIQSITMYLIGIGFVVISAYAIYAVMWWEDFEGIRSSFEYHRLCRERESLSATEFFDRHYRDSGIAADLVTAVRDFHATFFGEDPGLLRPEDDLFQINSGLDCSEWFDEIRDRFQVEFPQKVPPKMEAQLPKVDASFETVLRCIHLLRQSSGSLSAEAERWER